MARVIQGQVYAPPSYILCNLVWGTTQAFKGAGWGVGDNEGKEFPVQIVLTVATDREVFSRRLSICDKADINKG